MIYIYIYSQIYISVDPFSCGIFDAIHGTYIYIYINFDFKGQILSKITDLFYRIKIQKIF